MKKILVSWCLLLTIFVGSSLAAANDNNVEWNGLYHDSFNSYYRSPFGAVPTGSAVNIKFRSFRFDLTAVYLRVYELDPTTGVTVGPTDYPFSFLTNEGTTYDIWQVNLTMPSTPKLYYYKFRVVDGTDEDYYSDAYSNDHDNLGQGGDGTTTDGEPFPSFQITVYKSDFSTPSWLHNSAVYQIFPDRFRNGNSSNDWCRPGSTTGCPSLYGAGTAANIVHTTWNEAMIDPRATGNNNAYGSQFYGGDLQGIEQKLDYIKGLGIDTIYMTPIFAARSNHGYDADDFFQIAPQLGGDPAFNSLVAAANARGMRLILDGVWNHVSQDSIYMDYYNRYPGLGGCESFASPYRSWFTWNATATTVPCTWTHYNGWFGFGGLPELTESPTIRDFFYRDPTNNVTKHWFDRGTAGWRFDVADSISHDWWTEYRGFAKTYKADAPLIGEVWQDASRYLAGNQLDSVMNYRFRKNTLGFARGFDFEDNDNSGSNKIVGLNPSQFNRSMLAIREDYPLQAQLAMLNLLDSHDTNRALFVLKNSFESQAEAKERLKLAAIFQFTYLGSPMVYYGDEAALNSPSAGNSPGGLAEDDPYNRAPYPWADESGNTGVYGPADSSMISFYSTLGAIRKINPALRTGSFQEILMGDITPSTTDNNIYAFARVSGNNKVLVVLNNGTSVNSATIPVGNYFADGDILQDLLGSASLAAVNLTVSGGNININLPARSGAILTLAAPTAAEASISGRVTLNNGFGARRVRIALQDTLSGEIYKTQTDGDGYYRFEGLSVGKFYTITPSLRNYRFKPGSHSLSLFADIDYMNFTALRNF